ncbi:MAG: KAP family NTPase [Acidimicrobiia bacterium]|nr:KAP family NTPase [Acidimicrobiia bacterium]
MRTDADDAADSEPRGLEAFRDEFSRLMGSEDLRDVRRVVVLVDDLDRCLPDTVVETLETIRLFLAVPKMAFVIAADEDRVAEAIRQRYPGAADDREEPARLYLHKIVQTTIPLPSLSRFDTEAYLLLLQLAIRLDADQLAVLVDQCEQLRLRSATLDDLPGIDDVEIAAELAFAARLTPMLYEKLRGNPRRIKRFLNDLRIRQSVASRRGIALAPDVVAKLMVLEVLLETQFKQILDWLATGNLRAEIQRLEVAAGRTRPPQPAETETPTPAADEQSSGDGEEASRGFSDDLLRWAKLPGTVDRRPGAVPVSRSVGCGRRAPRHRPAGSIARYHDKPRIQCQGRAEVGE